MPELPYEFIDSLSNPILVSDLDGNLLHQNAECGAFFTDLIGRAHVSNLKELGFNAAIVPRDDKRYKLKCGDVPLFCRIHAGLYQDQRGYLIIFDKCNYVSAQVATVLECIDDALVVMDSAGIVKFTNRNFQEATQTGAAPRQDTPVQLGLALKCLDKSPGLEALRQKRVVQMQVTYQNGRSLFYTAAPILEGGVRKNAVSTGRDVTRYIQEEKALERALREARSCQEEMDALTKDSFHVIVEDEKMLALYKKAIKVAPTSAPVLISGESGVGKEVIARLIHRQSQRADAPFVAVNCAAIPQQLLESEFFGYENGSFTGSAKGGKPGLLDAAHGGTLFLDELGEMPLELQSKLLRVIQDGRFFPVGGTRWRRADIRYVSATNADVHRPEKLRQDLFYRLSVVKLHLPPLRERRGDIPPLVDHWMEQFNQKYGKAVLLAPDAERFARAYDWPGNVRQLKNVLERTVLLSDSDIVTLDDLRFTLGLECAASGGEPVTVDRVLPLRAAVAQLEEQLIHRLLETEPTLTVSALAARMGVAPSTVYRHLNQKQTSHGREALRSPS